MLLASCQLLLSSVPGTTTLVGASTVECSNSDECERVLRPGSRCVNGLCTNPFHHGGCLKSMLPGWNKTRVCNTQDPPEAEALGYCRPSPIGYEEIRIASFNWESANFVAWILQILLSEVLDVPTSMEAGHPDIKTNLYDVNSRFDFQKAQTDYYYNEINVANRVKDCALVTDTDDPNDYEACFHFVPEAWTSDNSRITNHDGLDLVSDLKLLGENSIFIPKFAAERDPALVSYLGLQGEKNRRRVAETFKRPTRWKQYCDEISLDNCAMEDGVAKRAPATKEEENMFFMEGVYTGHFRKTEKADCDRYQHGCTGVFINYPCGWTTHVGQIAHHLNIAWDFEGSQLNGGYSYNEIVEIWEAGNATKEAVAMMWWTPTPMYEKFLGTDAEFTRVLFQPATQECVDARSNYDSLCEDNSGIADGEVYGDAVGACDYFPLVTQKLFSKALDEITSNEDVKVEFWSPAAHLLRSFQIDNRQIDKIYDSWGNRGTDYLNYYARDATCQWVVDNFDMLLDYIPTSHPRVVVEVNKADTALARAALGLAICAVSLVAGSIIMTYQRRKTKPIYQMQVEFLAPFLVGLLSIAVGTMLLALPLSDEKCQAFAWLANLGFALQFTPLLVRIAAINKLATEGKQMQRVRLKRKIMVTYLAVTLTLVLTFTLVWQLVDPPVKSFDTTLTGETTSDGRQIITAEEFCDTEHRYWYFVAFGVWVLTIMCGCMIAYIALQVREDMNDTKTMALVLFTHLIFLITLVTVFGQKGTVTPAKTMLHSCILFSADTIVILSIYIMPKFFHKGDKVEKELLPDLFVHTTVALIDICGFSSWSSVREPVQVFQFLELLYENFDRVATRSNVYKVETVGEMYVAAAGVPKSQPDHAVIMARFALVCVRKMPSYVKMMETQFGPDTGDLSLRIGMHSGPVTGGCLRGKGARRFQLFGDTMTTAQLMLANSKSGFVHVSEATAKLLSKGGKDSWVKEREDKLQTEERGELQTFWLSTGVRDSQRHILEHADSDSSIFLDGNENELTIDQQSEERWIEWNVSVFVGLLKQVIARRTTLLKIQNEFSQRSSISEIERAPMPLEEVKEIIELPTFDKRAARRQRENQDVEIPDTVVRQLKAFITEIASLYNANPFHNFAHASYVVMAITKYMNRIIAATELDLGDKSERFRSSVQEALHDHTYGITSDPLTHFACAFSALIHDVQHPGVPNNRMIIENEDIAERYQGRSVAEQNSLDRSWNLLTEERFSELLTTICATSCELKRFRQLVVNMVMATDLGDAELKALRNGRWERAFARDYASSVMTGSTNGSVSSRDALDEEAPSVTKERNPEKKRIATNRKATIVIEHLIQAADVAHMSQHWSIYRKWNERLFRELYQAYREGRSESNPADGWYKGEIGFFDFYIIPLSEKIRDCGVFGPTSDENLNYATNNRNLWVKEGEAITKEMLKRAEAHYRLECNRVSGERGLRASRTTNPNAFRLSASC